MFFSTIIHLFLKSFIFGLFRFKTIICTNFIHLLRSLVRTRMSFIYRFSFFHIFILVMLHVWNIRYYFSLITYLEQISSFRIKYFYLVRTLLCFFSLILILKRFFSGTLWFFWYLDISFGNVIVLCIEFWLLLVPFIITSPNIFAFLRWHRVWYKISKVYKLNMIFFLWLPPFEFLQL